ncbi:MAG: hypothetical protein QOD41_4158 [Cryptosporangiaceae bacterium]|nr:hypothetical protein [Cryptosporangiaceae bacterium]
MSNSSGNADAPEFESEQKYISMLYGRLDELRERATTRLARALRHIGGTPQARTERDAAAGMYTVQIAQYGAVETGLCFGRLDFQTGEQRYIGRIGIFDEDGDYEPLLMDWRAPAARPFYLATAASPDGVRRRRYIKTSLRKVVRLDDDVLDLDLAATVGAPSAGGLTGEATLMAALNASRTGRMGDIVETIQAEQDRIIRSTDQGVLVVQGGPGTGKTAVALHRAAYLLYTHRQRLAKQGVLIVGPNATFLRYISQVLPALGETGVLLSTAGELFPGIDARAHESERAAEIKGRIGMATVVSNAIRDRQGVPRGVIEIRFDREVLRLDRRLCLQARTRARRSRRPHNEARALFGREIVNVLSDQIAGRLGKSISGGRQLLDPRDLAQIRAELRTDENVLAALDELWPDLTPQKLLRELYSSPERLASAAPGLTQAERAALVRDPQHDWTPADVPLLDEAAELLGEDDRAAKARKERERRERIAYAQGVLDITAGSSSYEFEDEASELLTATDLMDAESFAERHEEREYLTAADRAAADRSWVFGHIIVDEAQELSEMVWRVLMRRCPSRSMTLVGDVAQTGDPAGSSSWASILTRYQQDRWRLEQLTVNYRTPAEIMAVATDVLAAVGPELEPPKSVRESGSEPWRREVPAGEFGARLAEAAAAEAERVGDGRLAVIVPGSRLTELAAAVREQVPGAAVGEDPELENRVVVLSVRQVKGLEFDSVLVADPALIIGESPRGLNDVYVAITRATQRLGVLHSGPIPPVLSRLDQAVAAGGPAGQ